MGPFGGYARRGQIADSHPEMVPHEKALCYPPAMSFGRSLVILGSLIALVQLGAFWAATEALHSHGASMQAMVAKMDQVEYLQLADTMLGSHRFALSPDAPAEIFRTPGYPAFVAFTYLVSGHWYWAPFVANALLLGLIAIVVALLSSELGLSRRSSLIAGALIGLSSGSFLLSMTATGSDVLYTLIYACAVLAALRVRDETYRPLAVGLLLGVATLTRPIGILASLPLLLGAESLHTQTWGSYVRKTALSCAVWLLVLCPWYVRNDVVAGTPLLSTVSLFNMTRYNIPMNESFWRHVDEDVARDSFLVQVGTSSADALRGADFIAPMRSADKEYLSAHGSEYGIFHLYRTLPFFLMSGFNVINAVLSHEAPTLRMPLFPSESENLTALVAAHRWDAALRAVSRYWFTTLERVSWLVAIGIAFVSPLLATGRTRRVLLLFLGIIVANIILVSPVTQARYRFPAEPFIWSATVAGYCLLRERLSAKAAPDVR